LGNYTPEKGVCLLSIRFFGGNTAVIGDCSSVSGYEIRSKKDTPIVDAKRFSEATSVGEISVGEGEEPTAQRHFRFW
jgi:desulfoferrodoxin (superoxide reductase-like protein)